MLSKDEFVRRILDDGPADAEAETDSGFGDAMLEGFDGFDVEDDTEQGTTDARFAQLLLEESGFGRGETLPRREVVLGDQKTNRFLPHGAAYWSKSAERPFHILLFDLELKGTTILDDAFFRQSDQLEDALHRIVQDALEGFERGGEGRTADRKRGSQTETLCVVSVIDNRRDGPERQIVCFGTKCTATDALEVFTLREEARDWDRPLAEEHLGQLFERHFKRLGTGARWQDAFVSGEERKKARKLMDECARLIPDEAQLRRSILALLDEIAGSFGIKRKGGRGGSRLALNELPPNHSIAVDPADARQNDFQNPFQGVRVFDSEERLLGYIVYVLDNKEKAAQLRREIEEHNHFHNVLVIYPDQASAVLELWQGDTLLRGRLTTGARRSRFDGDGGVIQLLSRFFVVSKSEIATPQHLASELAWRALHLRALALEETRSDTGQLAALYDSFNESLARSTPEEFADAYAQTIAYGLLAARWLSRDIATRFTRRSSISYLPSSSPFLRELFVHLLDIPFDTNLSWLLDDLTSLLSRTKVSEVFEGERDPSIHFFQDFLSEYDQDTRRARGVYYTPQEIVDYMVRLADEALGSLPRDAHRSGRRRVGSEGLRIVDPATGTGTFLRSVIQYCANTQGDAGVARCLRNIRGMELMVAPYAICHLRLSLLRRELLGDDSGQSSLGIVLTNSLELPRSPSPDLFERAPALAHEAELANSVKTEGGFTLVIGNPPYRNNSSSTLAQIAERFPALLGSSRAAAAAQQRNIRDDYAWFFAAADSLTDGGGAVCFVTSDSYLKKGSYRHFRQEVLRRYRIVEITRLGAGVFESVGPRIDFAIITMLRRSKILSSADHAEPFRLVDLSPLAKETPPKTQGTSSDPRLQWLAGKAAAESVAPVVATEVKPVASANYRFLATNDDDVSAAELKYQIVSKKNDKRFSSLFLKKWPGVITAFDRLLKDDSREELGSRMSQFFSLASEQAEEAEVRAFGESFGCRESELERLAFLVRQARHAGYGFNEAQIRPVFAGSIPLGNEWYPPTRFAHWIYFEPRIKIPRNTNPGKDKGWGWMQQWRPEVTHLQFPKLIFTTSTNRRYGFRAYVVDSKWFTKLDGAASQKYHYVSLHDPTKPASLEGRPNNLTESGYAALSSIRQAGLEDYDLLHIIAAIYNSSYGLDYAKREAEIMLPLPDLSGVCAEILSEIASLARRLRRAWADAQPETAEVFPTFETGPENTGLESDAAQKRLNALISSLVKR